ncbi:MAG TPA: PAS domain S-box protein [Aromatoleum sp.]|uniref:PAS domain S-box protein n=1 Tax=Aromatoleum sp. TaxID=2307007 RepID=UPI002B49CD17|nr:PAS domain S-box protein [Aromatoleum sp.]HJV26248.1 PAS domain S-box protein [Aromatoleum sp.]
MIEGLRFLKEPADLRSLEPVFDAMLEGVVVRDGRGAIVVANAAARRMLDFDTTIGTDGAEEKLAAATLRSGQAQRAVVLALGSGTERMWIQASAQPICDAGGAIAGVVTTLSDITPMKLAEEALRLSEGRNRTLAEAIAQSGCAVIMTDPSGRIEFVNSACCKAYGYSQEELLGASPSIFKSGETPREEYEALWRTILAGEVWRGEMSNRTRDGRLIREAVSVSPVRDELGEIRHFIALKEDITPLREEERRRHALFERVARLERIELVATLAGGIAHDFNNVLVAILGYSELAERMLKADGRLPRVASYIDEIRIAGARARDLIHQLLNFSRSGVVQPRLTRLEDIGREAVGLLRATLPDTVALIPDIDPALPAMSFDPAHLHQIVMNLLMNARDAVNGKGTIRLSARRVSIAPAECCDSCRREFSGDYVAITVADDGVGISAEYRLHLFEPFFTTKEIGQGTGMGLAVVHSVAHVYDGHVKVVSTPGEGCAITVLLPVLQHQD